MCVSQSTSGSLLNRLMDVTCLHTPPETDPLGHSMNQWTDITEEDKVLDGGLKGAQRPWRHNRTHQVYTPTHTCVPPRGFTLRTDRG